MRIGIAVLLGMEAVVAAELRRMGYEEEAISSRDGMVYLMTGNDRQTVSRDIARLNIWLRAGERVFLEVGHGSAPDFDELFILTSSLPWNEFCPQGYFIHIERGYSRRSRLEGVPACQAIIKKAIVRSVLRARNMPETARLEEDPLKGRIGVHFAIIDDECSLLIDTSGVGLHKRGYRIRNTMAPLRESLAAGMLLLARREELGGMNSDEAIWDPFCGGGTIPIEAALILSNTAPGLDRSFAGEEWPYLDPAAFKTARAEALSAIVQEPPERPMIIGSDIDVGVLEHARFHAERAGVEDWIDWRVFDATELKPKYIHKQTGMERCLVMANPPWGERLMQAAAVEEIYRNLTRNLFAEGVGAAGIRLYLFTADEDFETVVGYRADQRRKLYNGMVRCTLFQYYRQYPEKISAGRPSRPRRARPSATTSGAVRDSRQPKSRRNNDDRSRPRR